MVSICLLPTLAFFSPPNVCLLAEEGKLMIALVKENYFWFCTHSHLVSHSAACAIQSVARG